MCAPPLLSRTFNRNFTSSQTLFSIDGLIRLHSHLILSLRSSIEVTGLVYTFSFKWPYKKSQGVKTGERGVRSTGPPLPIQFPGLLLSKFDLTRNEQCADPSSWRKI